MQRTTTATTIIRGGVKVGGGDDVGVDGLGGGGARGDGGGDMV